MYIFKSNVDRVLQNRKGECGMKKVFMIVFEDELEFAKGSNLLSERFINSDGEIEYCGSWGKTQFNKDECLNAISSTVNHFIQMPDKKEYFGCVREDVPEIEPLLLRENCKIIISSYINFAR